MREADLAGARHVTAADQACLTNGVMRRPKRPLTNHATVIRQQASNAVNGRAVDGFFEAEWREQTRQEPREHGLAATGWPHHEQVVPAGRGNFERAACGRLAAH